MQHESSAGILRALVVLCGAGATGTKTGRACSREAQRLENI
jgi:hypothetical protein